MTSRRAYLDYNATAPIRPEAKAAALAAMETLGNPASVHAAGRATRALVEQARADVAALVAVKPASITFTSGGTESNALAIRTPYGLVVHTGDWKIDPTPYLGSQTSEEVFRALGDEGVLALICDSTNVVRDGVSPS